AGVILGYLAYEVVHYGVHAGGGGGRLVRFWRRHHFYHHYADDRRCYGFTTPMGLRLWDRTGAGSRSPIASRGRVDSMRRLARWIRYVNAMFPPVILAPVGAAQFLSLYLVLQTLGGVTPLRLGWRAAIGAAST